MPISGDPDETRKVCPALFDTTMMSAWILSAIN